jgi:hypothetical protein
LLDKIDAFGVADDASATLLVVASHCRLLQVKDNFVALGGKVLTQG